MLKTLDTYNKTKHADALLPGLRLDPMNGHGKAIADEDTDAVIRGILTEDAQAAPAAPSLPRGEARRRALPAIEAQDQFADPKARRQAGRPVREIPQNTAPQKGVKTAPVQVADTSVAPKAVANGIYPEDNEASEADAPAGKDRRWVKPAIIGAVVAAALLRPWLILLPLFLAFWGVIITVTLMGGGSFGDGFARIYRWTKERNPARAERLRARMDRIAMRVDDVIDRVPGGALDALALPDFSDAALDPRVGEGLPDPFERLAGDTRAH